MKFYAPSIAGGDQYEALKYYNKACALMEQNKNTKVWYYLFIKRQYAKACLKMNDAETAKKTYLELLEIEPNYKLAIKEFNTLKQ